MRRALNPAFAPYLKPYQMLKTEVAAMGLAQEHLILDDEEAKLAVQTPSQVANVQGRQASTGVASAEAAMREAGSLRNGGGSA